MSLIKRYHYDDEKGLSTFSIYDTKRKVRAVGKASLHEDDVKFRSEFAGLTIAEIKAQTEFYLKRSKIKAKEAERLKSRLEAMEKYVAEDLEKSEYYAERYKTYVKMKNDTYRKLEEKRSKGSKEVDSPMQFEDLGDLTIYMTDEQKEQAKKEIDEGIKKAEDNK